ncbi:hypothetical protein, partial [Mycolicibacterium rhodesiae]|uniref:hypothetical protein n=1 Tax=Mycolicibacterium rhodesiae TaxID=36814 RepID=UPI0021F25680
QTTPQPNRVQPSNDASAEPCSTDYTPTRNHATTPANPSPLDIGEMFRRESASRTLHDVNLGDRAALKRIALSRD